MESKEVFGDRYVIATRKSRGNITELHEQVVL